MFHVHAMGNIVSGVEFVIKTWTFLILMGGILMSSSSQHYGNLGVPFIKWGRGGGEISLCDSSLHILG
jgi:hypothetical protein